MRMMALAVGQVAHWPRRPPRRPPHEQRGSARSAVLIGAAVVAILALQVVFLGPEKEHHGAESHLHVDGEGKVGGGTVQVVLDHPSPSDLLITLSHRSHDGDLVSDELAHRTHNHEAFSHGFALPDAFVGRPVEGEWALHLHDEAFGDHGELAGWTLQLRDCREGRPDCLSESYTSTQSVPIEDLHVNWGSGVFWGSVGNFALLLFLLVYLGKNPMKSFLVARRDRIQKDLLEARELRAQAQKQFDEYTERLERLDHDLESIRSDMVKAGEEERARIVAEAEKKASRMRKDAAFLIQQQLKQLRIDITRETVRAAVAEARSVLQSATADDDQTRLARDYLDQLRRQPSAAEDEAPSGNRSSV